MNSDGFEWGAKIRPRPPTVEYTLVENDDAPDELGLYELVDGEQISKLEWIVALEGSYVSLEDVR